MRKLASSRSAATIPIGGSHEAALGPKLFSSNLFAVLYLVLLSGVWMALSQSVFFVGPSEWDDNVYCDIAALPRPMASIASRYFHIWTLRLFNLVMDTRQSAAGLYPALLTVGLSWVGFFLGRRIGGGWCGAVAALLMPFYTALMKYLTVPYSDTPMALWSAVAILCALAAAERQTARAQALAVAASGFFTLLATQCKETGIAVVPPVWLALWACRPRWKTAVWWLAGGLAGWLLLSILDYLFIDDFFWHWHWSTYFPTKEAGDTSAPSKERMNLHYLEVLTDTDLLAFTLLGVAGAVAVFGEQLAGRCLGVWAFSVLAFSSFISSWFFGVQALDRYCVGLGVPLVVLSAYWIIRVWKGTVGSTEGAGGHRPVGLIVAGAITFGAAVYGQVSKLIGEPEKLSVRLGFFMMPPALLLLFLVPWLTSGRWVRRLALVLLLAAAATLNIYRGIDYGDFKRKQLQPWIELTEALDATGAKLAKWDLPRKPFTDFRIARRCRTLSKLPPAAIAVREIESLNELREGEWLFSSPEAWEVLKPRGWNVVTTGKQESVSFVVYGPPGNEE